MRKKSARLPHVSRSVLASVFAALVLPSGTALAQKGDAEASAALPGEIIVTAQRRSESLQKVPVAMTALSSETLSNQGITNLDSLATVAPSLKVVAYPNSSDTLTLTMRGQGAADVGQITRDGGVGLYVDGFYIGRPQGALLDLGDPERIEVLRGPQGTLYGRNTTGGAINIVTKKPTGEWGGSGTLSMGSRNLVRALAAVDLPAFGELAIKGSVTYVNQDGWVKNEGARLNFGEFGQLAGRIAAKWTPTDELTVHYGFNLGRVQSTPLYYINPTLEGRTSGPLQGYFADPDRTYAPLDLDYSVAKFVDHQLTLEYDLSDSFTMRSLTAYRGFRATQNVNYGVSQSPTFFDSEGDIVGDFPLTVVQDHFYRVKQYSQEVQLIGDISDRLNVTGGLYWFRESGRHDVATHLLYLSDAGDTAQEKGRDVVALSKSYAAYAQATWTPGLLEDRLKLTFGGRYTRDERTATRNSFVDDDAVDVDVRNQQKFSNFSPMVNLAVEWNRDLMTYAKFSQGYKAGGSSEDTPDFRNTFGPEQVDAWEAGVKAQLFDRRLILNLAAFYNKFDDMQISFVSDPNDTSIGYVANAGRASIKGIELDATLRASSDFSINASFAHMTSTLKRVDVLPGSIFDQDPDIDVGDNIAGLFTLPFVPKFAYSVGADWTFLRMGDNEFSAHGNYAYQGAVYTSSGAGPDVPGREFYRNDPVKNLNARISWSRPIPSGRQMKLSIFADNLLNDRRSDFVFGLGGTALSGYTSQALPYNEPRVIGGELKLSF